MNAVVEIAGFQYMVSKNLLLKVPKLDGKDGDIVRIPRVLALSDGKKTEVGRPYLDNAYVDVRLLNGGKYPKILVYKYKRRKKYRRMKGHRQDYTEIMIVDIGKGSCPDYEKSETLSTKHETNPNNLNPNDRNEESETI